MAFCTKIFAVENKKLHIIQQNSKKRKVVIFMNLPTYQSNDELPLVMNVKDVAGYLHISTTCAYTLMNAESFPALKIGNRILIPRERFLEWLENSRGQVI